MNQMDDWAFGWKSNRKSNAGLSDLTQKEKCHVEKDESRSGA